MSSVRPLPQAHPATIKRHSFARRFMGLPMGVGAATFLLLLVLACAAAPLIAPDNPGPRT